MIADVSRAYTPTVKFSYASFQQQSIANIQAFTIGSPNGTYPNNILPVTCDPTLIHRKVWAYLLSVSATYSSNVDLVASLNGQEVYRQNIIIQNSAVVNQKIYFCIAPFTVNQGSQREQLVTTVAGTSVFGVCPHYLNIAADKFFMDIRSITGGAALFDGGMFVQSQAGI